MSMRAVCWLLLLGTGVGAAQVGEETLGVPTDIEKAFRAASNSVPKILSNPSPSAADKANLDAVAKYLVLRVTWLDNVSAPDKMGAVVKEFDASYNQWVVKTKPEREPHNVFHARLTENFKAVFARKFEQNRLSSVNAAQMLPIVAKGKNAEFSDFLVTTIKDPAKHDAIKVFAVRGLREYFPLRPYTPTDVRDKKVVAPDIERIDTLKGYIERKWPATTSKEEQAAHVFLRREAVSSLAAAQAPVAMLVKGKADGDVASTLVKVLAKDMLQPPPALAERCEAGIGIANMKYLADFPDYNPALAMYGEALALAEFINTYRGDFGNLGKKAGQLPYKTLSDRWKVALENQDKNTKDTPANAFARGIHDRSKGMLDNILLHKQVDNQTAVDFGRWIETQKPSVKTLYKGSKAEFDFGK